MAENAKWAQRLFGENRKIAVWAHNFHVANYASYGSMGYYLKQALGDAYKVIGFSFCEGDFMAVGYDKISQKYTGLKSHSITDPPYQGSLTHLLSAAEKKTFILRIDKLSREDPLLRWVQESRMMLSIGAVFNGSPMEYYSAVYADQYFDILIHFNRTSAAVQI